MEAERCPWCGSEITHEQFTEITARIRAEEHARFEEVKVEAKRDATAAAQAPANSRIAAIQAERDQAVAAQRAAEAKTEAARLAERKAIEEQVKKEHERELKDQRETLPKAHDKKSLRVISEHAREREAHQAELRELQRKHENNTQ